MNRNWRDVEGAEWLYETHPGFAGTNIRCIELTLNRTGESHALWALEYQGEGFLLRTHFSKIEDVTIEWAALSSQIDELDVVRDGAARTLDARAGTSTVLRVVCGNISLSGGAVWR